MRSIVREGLFDPVEHATIAVLLVGLVVFHAISVCAYQIGLDNEVDLTNEMRVAERLPSKGAQ